MMSITLPKITTCITLNFNDYDTDFLLFIKNEILLF